MPNITNITCHDRPPGREGRALARQEAAGSCCRHVRAAAACSMDAACVPSNPPQCLRQLAVLAAVVSLRNMAPVGPNHPQTPHPWTALSTSRGGISGHWPKQHTAVTTKSTQRRTATTASEAMAHKVLEQGGDGGGTEAGEECKEPIPGTNDVPAAIVRNRCTRQPAGELRHPDAATAIDADKFRGPG
jgi:hypothetical protein